MLAVTSNEVSITLKEITDLIGTEHNKAMKVISKLAEEPSFGAVAKVATVYNSQGQTIDTYMLTKKQAIASAAKLKNSMLMMVIDRLEELEGSKQEVKLPSKLELAQMVIESETKVLELEHRIEEKDKVIIAVADLNIKAGEVTVGDFSKNLAIEGLGQNNLFKWLKGRGFLMHNTAPYQQYVDRGYFKRKPTGTHNGEVRYITMLTPKGTVWLTKMLKAEFELED